MGSDPAVDPDIGLPVGRYTGGYNTARDDVYAKYKLTPRDQLLLDAESDLIRERGLKETVLVTKTGCQHHCSRGTTVSVWPHNHWYGHVTLDDAESLLEAALAGVEVEKLRMPPGPWE